MSNRLPLVGAIILGLLAVFLSNRYFQKKEENLFQGTEPKPILTAARDIPIGTVIKKNDLKITEIPAKFIQPAAADSLKAVTGKITIAFIFKNEQILSTKLACPEKERWLAVKTPLGKRAVSISADGVTAISGLLKPGDYVDILGTFDLIKIGRSGKQEIQSVTLPLFQNVLVLAVDKKMSKFSLSKQDKRGLLGTERETSTVTLALSPQEAEHLVFAEEKGKIRLMLRGAEDKEGISLSAVNFKSLLRNFSSLSISQRQKKESEKENVEVFRGLEKEEVVPLER